MGKTRIGHRLLQFNELDSTSNYIAKSLEMGQYELETVIMAYFQTGGRGQQGRVWHSAAGENLLLSFGIDLAFLGLHQQFLVSKVISLAIARMLEQTGIHEVRIKWPNDVLVGQRKIAGILLENKVVGKQRITIAGIGLNVNQVFKDDPFKATSMAQELGRSMALSALYSRLIKVLNEVFEMLHLGQTQLIDSAYFEQLYGSGQWIEFKDKDQQYLGKIQTVDHQGLIAVKSKMGYTRVYQLREVQITY